MFVLADSVKNADINIMNLTVRMVEGILEPVKLISAAGFAVGHSDTVYTWEVRYQQPESDEDGRLDGVNIPADENIQEE